MRSYITRALLLLFCLLLYSSVMYGLHVIIDNAGADIGTTARIVDKMGSEPSFIFSIKHSDVNIDAETLQGDELLRHSAYVIGPKFVLFTMATVTYRLMDLLFSRSDPLSALFFTNLFCLFGSALLINAMAFRPGEAKNRMPYLLLPVLFLSLPSTYYLVHDPSYPHVITLFLLGGIYLVMSAYKKGPGRLAPLLLASGFVFGLMVGIGSQALLCLFAGAVFTGILAFSKRCFIKSLVLQGLGVIIAVAISEAIFQFFGSSLFELTWLHIHENLYANKLDEPFPFIPLIYLRILWALTPITVIVFFGGLGLHRRWWKDTPVEGRSLVLTIVIVIVTMSFLPTTPLIRIIFPFFIIMQTCIFMMIMNTNGRAVKRLAITLLLCEVLLSLPSSLFITQTQDGYKSPMMHFENELLVLKHFEYQTGTVPGDDGQ